MGKKIITHSNGVIETREVFYTEETIQQLKQQLEEKNKEINEILLTHIDNDSYNETVREYERELKERDKEIEKWYKLYKDRDNQFQSVRQRYHLINRLQASYDKRDKLHLSEMQCLELVEKNEELQKNQKQLAIQELEKVKDFAFKNTMLGIETVAIINQINQQIKELKGE